MITAKNAKEKTNLLLSIGRDAVFNSIRESIKRGRYATVVKELEADVQKELEFLGYTISDYNDGGERLKIKISWE